MCKIRNDRVNEHNDGIACGKNVLCHYLAHNCRCFELIAGTSAARCMRRCTAGQEKERMGGEGEKEERLAQEEGVRGAGVCARERIFVTIYGGVVATM